MLLRSRAFRIASPGLEGLFIANRFFDPGKPLGILRSAFCPTEALHGGQGVRPEKLTDRSLIALYESRQIMAATVAGLRSRVIGQHSREYAEKLRAEMERRQIQFTPIDWHDRSGAQRALCQAHLHGYLVARDGRLYQPGGNDPLCGVQTSKDIVRSGWLRFRSGKYELTPEGLRVVAAADVEAEDASNEKSVHE